MEPERLAHASDDEETSSDDDDVRVALAYDPNELSGSDGPPQNGHDYLRLVQMQRAQITPISCSRPPQTDCDDIPKPNEGLRLEDSEDDLSYRDEVVKNFLELRAKIDSIREEVPARQPIDEQQLSEKQIMDYKERSERRASSLVKQMSSGFPPQIGALVKKNQFEIHKTLELLADQCEVNPTYSTLHTDWIYSLMATLQEPIEPDICSTLRRLARLCILRRKMYEKRKASASVGVDVSAPSSHLLHGGGGDKDGGTSRSRSRDNEELVKEVEEEEYTSSLLVICIVRHHFGQIDLK